MDSAKSSHAKARTLPYHPSIKKGTMQSLITNFPTALSTSDSVQKINNAILSLGCKTDNTLFACSICPDEINHHSGSINRRLADFWGACFYMGGLGGLPFVGKVGFGAYSHHVPKDGALFILFAPHVGLSPDGLVGKYARAGQDHLDPGLASDHLKQRADREQFPNADRLHPDPAHAWATWRNPCACTESLREPGAVASAAAHSPQVARGEQRQHRYKKKAVNPK